MFKTIERPANCEIRSVIRFLNARNVKPADIHRQICEVYGENATSDGMVRKWVRQFKEGRENVHDEARSGWPSVVNDDLVRAVDSKVHEDRRFTISSLSLHLPQISRTILYEIVSDRLNYQKLCSCWVPKMLSEGHKTKRAGSALSFLNK
jgi:oligoribonuclease (3'-5' exoribonuclease)